MEDLRTKDNANKTTQICLTEIPLALARGVKTRTAEVIIPEVYKHLILRGRYLFTSYIYL